MYEIEAKVSPGDVEKRLERVEAALREAESRNRVQAATTVTPDEGKLRRALGLPTEGEAEDARARARVERETLRYVLGRQK